MKTHSPRTTLHCFTPAVTLTTFLIEVALGAYAIVRYRRTRAGQLGALLVFLLAAFQIAEFMVCQGINTATWARIGWVCVTFLPPVGLHLIATLTHRPPTATRAGYVLGAVLASGFVMNQPVFTAVSCPGNFVEFIFHEPLFNSVYSFYYFAFILIGVVQLGATWRLGKTNRTLAGWLLLGYASFILPTAVVYAISPAPIESFPSVFCGFAILLALIIAGKVLPLANKLRQ